MTYWSRACPAAAACPDLADRAVLVGLLDPSHPEPYLAAARLLKVDLGACIAIEDSPPGVASAVAAGIPTIAVPHHVSVPETVGAVQISKLAGLNPSDLLKLFNPRPG